MYGRTKTASPRGSIGNATTIDMLSFWGWAWVGLALVSECPSKRVSTAALTF